MTRWTSIAAACCLVPAVFMLAGGCGGGPDVIGGHDYSSFYDFGGSFDTIGADAAGLDASIRDTPGTDSPSTDLTPSDQGTPGDTTTDTTVATPTVVFVTDKAWETRAKAMIADAKKTVDLVHLEFLMYSPEDISIAASLKNAAGRGVKIRVLLDDDVDDNPDRVGELNAVSNITAKLDGWNGTTHVKLIVVDGVQALVGSTNLSKASLHFNHEANLWITDAGAVPKYVDYFNALWAKPSTKSQMEATMTATGILPIGDGEYREAVSGYLENATDRIYLVMYDLNQDSYNAETLTGLLTDAAGRGVEVKVFLERCNESYASYVTDDNEESADILENGGAIVRFDEPYPDNNEYDDVTHAKLLIVDDTVVVYSGNWNNSGLNNNHEAGAVVHKVASVTADAVRYFNETLWKYGVDWP